MAQREHGYTCEVFRLVRDYYDILGIRRNASARDIKTAFRQLARQYHPDVTGNDPQATERFKEISEAYETLSDPQKRRRYDLFGHPNQPSTDSSIPFDPFEKIQEFVSQVGEMFKPQTTDPAPGIDIERTISISFAESYLGGEKEISLTGPRPCQACAGKGRREQTTAPLTCSDCNGSGKASPFDFLPMGLRCATCDGAGTVPAGPCRQCHGQGARIQTEKLKVYIPAGLPDGGRIRLPGQGQAGKRGGPPGDLYIVVQLKPDHRFHRQGNRLLTRVQVSASRAQSGGEVKVALPDGKLTLSIPPGTQTGQTFRVEKRGFPSAPQTERQDLLVQIQIDTPTSQTSTEKQS